MNEEQATRMIRETLVRIATSSLSDLAMMTDEDVIRTADEIAKLTRIYHEQLKKQ